MVIARNYYLNKLISKKKRAQGHYGDKALLKDVLAV